MSDAFDEFLTSRSPRRVVIVGGGYIGLEMAESMTHRGFEVTVIEMAMTTIDHDPGELVVRELRSNGVTIVT